MVSRRLVLGGAIASIVDAHCAEANDTGFAVGQVWSLSGTIFVDAKIVIDRLEIWHEKTIAHISVTGLPKRDGGFQGTILHLPFTEIALRASVGRLISAEGTSFPGFEGGYDQWKAANGGVFTVTVQRAVVDILGQMPTTVPNTSASVS